MGTVFYRIMTYYIAGPLTEKFDRRRTAQLAAIWSVTETPMRKKHMKDE